MLVERARLSSIGRGGPRKCFLLLLLRVVVVVVVVVVVAVQDAQQGRLLTVWPSEMRKWASSNRQDVVKIERKIAGLLAEGGEGSVSLGADDTTSAPSCTHAVEFYGLNSAS